MRSQRPGGVSGATCSDPGESAPFTKATSLGHLFSAPKQQGGPQGLQRSCEHGRHPTCTRLTPECWEVPTCHVLLDECISPFMPKNHLSSFSCTQVMPPEATPQAFNQHHHSWRGVRGSALTLLHKEQIPLILRAPNHPGLGNRHWELTGKFPWWLRRYRICLPRRRPGFSPWVGTIPRRRAWQPTPVFLPGESPWTKETGGLRSRGLQRV